MLQISTFTTLSFFWTSCSVPIKRATFTSRSIRDISIIFSAFFLHCFLGDTMICANHNWSSRFTSAYTSIEATKCSEELRYRGHNFLFLRLWVGCKSLCLCHVSGTANSTVSNEQAPNILTVNTSGHVCLCINCVEDCDAIWMFLSPLLRSIHRLFATFIAHTVISRAARKLSHVSCTSNDVKIMNRYQMQTQLQTQERWWRHAMHTYDRVQEKPEGSGNPPLINVSGI